MQDTKNRRREERIKTTAEVSYRRAGSNVRHEGRLIDISSSGAFFTARLWDDEALRTGTRIQVTVNQGREVDQAFYLDALIVRVNDDPAKGPVGFGCAAKRFEEKPDNFE